MSFCKNIRVAWLVLCAALPNAKAAVLLEDTQLVSRSPAYEQVAPQAKAFTIEAAGRYRVTLTDVGFPGPLTSADLIIVQGVRTILHMTHTGSLDFDATPGTYLLRVLGNGVGPGQLGVVVAPSAGGTRLLDYSVGIAGNPVGGDPNRSIVATSFSVAQAGNYQVTLTDRAFPAALASFDLAIIDKDGTPVVHICAPANPPACGGNTASFAATAGDYDLSINALAASSAQAGLYSVRIENVPLSATPYAATHPVGALKPHAAFSFPSADQYTLRVSDLQFPKPLTSVQAAVVQGGNVLTMVSGATPQSFTAGLGSATLYAVASTTDASTVGTFGVQVAPSAQTTQSVFSDVRAVIGSTLSASTTGGARAYAFPANVTSAGQYRVQARDFAFPTAIAVLQMLVAQNGTTLGTLGSSGALTIQAERGPIVIVVVVDMLSSTATGLFAVSVDAPPAAQPLFSATQGVGDLFHSRSLTVVNAGSFDITAIDLGFPGAFAELALTVTRGNTLVGQVFGGGTFSFAGTPGDYSLNFIARSSTTQNYGLYGVKVEDTPPLPTVSLTATPSTVASGGTTTVSWSTTGATSCVASGGWSGSRPTSGSASSVGPFSTDTTLTLTCAGPGGSNSGAAKISIASEASKSGGGGADFELLIAIAVLLGATRYVRTASRM